MTFVVKLLKFKNLIINVIYDLILVIIDRLIKCSYLISFKKKICNEMIKFYYVKSINLLLRYITRNYK